jgi:hypothetical protein
MRHRLAGGIPLPAGVAMVRAGEVTVARGPGDGFAAHLRQALDRRLPHVPLATHGLGVRSLERILPQDVLRVGGQIFIDANDVRGRRRIRIRPAGADRLEQRDISTFVRRVRVRVDFVLSRHDGTRVAAAEAARAYSSAADPNVRGRLGLLRGDDPNLVPPVGAIVRELLDGCAADFCAMLAAVDMTAEVELRPAGGPHGRAGLRCAQQQRFPDAMRQFEAALANEPNSVDLHFNLAVAAEAAGELNAARAHSAFVRDRTTPADPAAVEGLRRVERVLLARRSAPPKPAP